MDIGSLKVGDKITFGAYTCAPDVFPPAPITWIKASRNCDFITEKAIDYLLYDAPEGSGGGNPDFHLSNLFGFLNGRTWDHWWNKTHDEDVEPQVWTVPSSFCPPQYGFLSDFSQHEINAIIPFSGENTETVSSLIRLPSVDDIFSGELEYFKRHGIRTTWSLDVIRGKFRHLGAKSTASYAEYWTRSRALDEPGYNNCVITVSRKAVICRKAAHLGAGIRPVCTINPNSKIEPYFDIHRISDNEYRKNFNGDILSLIG